jgi:FkbM family methyltransferase
VEPTPSHQELFKKITQGLDNVELVQAALADRDETIHFYTSVTNTTQNSIVNTGAVKGGDMFEVQGYCFDTLLDKYNLDHVDFCKIDIEGSEMVAITVEQMPGYYQDVLYVYKD